MSEHDPFLQEPVNRLALTYLRDIAFDGETGTGLQQAARDLCEQPFMQAIPDNKRSVIACLAAKRAHDATDDVIFMDVVTR